MMLWRPSKQFRLSRGNPWARQLYRAGAWIYTVLALIMLVLAWRIPFQEPIDFDVSGFLFLISNIPALFFWGVALTFVSGAIYCWVRVLLSPPSADDPFA